MEELQAHLICSWRRLRGRRRSRRVKVVLIALFKLANQAVADHLLVESGSGFRSLQLLRDQAQQETQQWSLRECKSELKAQEVVEFSANSLVLAAADRTGDCHPSDSPAFSKKVSEVRPAQELQDGDGPHNQQSQTGPGAEQKPKYVFCPEKELLLPLFVRQKIFEDKKRRIKAFCCSRVPAEAFTSPVLRQFSSRELLTALVIAATVPEVQSMLWNLERLWYSVVVAFDSPAGREQNLRLLLQELTEFFFTAPLRPIWRLFVGLDAKIAPKVAPPTWERDQSFESWSGVKDRSEAHARARSFVEQTVLLSGEVAARFAELVRRPEEDLARCLAWNYRLWLRLPREFPKTDCSLQYLSEPEADHSQKFRVIELAESTVLLDLDYTGLQVWPKDETQSSSLGESPIHLEFPNLKTDLVRAISEDTIVAPYMIERTLHVWCFTFRKDREVQQRLVSVHIPQHSLWIVPQFLHPLIRSFAILFLLPGFLRVIIFSIKAEIIETVSDLEMHNFEFDPECRYFASLRFIQPRKLVLALNKADLKAPKEVTGQIYLISGRKHKITKIFEDCFSEHYVGARQGLMLINQRTSHFLVKREGPSEIRWAHIELKHQQIRVKWESYNLTSNLRFLDTLQQNTGNSLEVLTCSNEYHPEAELKIYQIRFYI